MQNRYFEILENRIFKLSRYLSRWFHAFLGESHHKGILIRHFSFTPQPIFKLNGRKQSMPWWINCQSKHIPTCSYPELPQPEEQCERMLPLLTPSALQRQGWDDESISHLPSAPLIKSILTTIIFWFSPSLCHFGHPDKDIFQMILFLLSHF